MTESAATVSGDRGNVRVLLVEDHGVFREGVAAVLDGLGGYDLIAAVDSGAQVLAAVECAHPDIILLDLRLPDISGLEVLRRLRASSSQVRVIVISSHDGVDTVRQAMALGAVGYILKQSGAEALGEALRAITAGKTFLDPALEQAMRGQTPGVLLSAREIQILKLASQGFTNGQIASNFKIAERTVKFHINSVFQKLGANDRTHAVTIALRRGILDL